MLKIRKATTNDLADILDVYSAARKYMRTHGNQIQWHNKYPQESVILSDIANDNLYVTEDDEGICGVFAFIFGEDPTYKDIDGKWLNDLPYAAIHRVASNGRSKGVFYSAFDYCSALSPQLRIDTHASNITMQNAVSNRGFVRCGTIITWDGTPRIAYHWSKEE